MPTLSLPGDTDDSRSYSHPSSPHAPFLPDSDYACSPSSDYSSHNPTSMLDLDHDPRASLVSTYSSYPQPDPDSQSDLRISLLGPKMRFHSPAPWELDEDPLPQQDDHPSSRPFFGTSIFSKHKDHHRASPSTSSDSPRPSGATRPSMDSTYSQVYPKRSFETTSSKFSYPRGALYALAQESLSATSLARVPHSDATYPSHVRSKSPSLSTPSSPHHSSSDSPLDVRLPQSSFPSHAAAQHPLESRPSYDDMSRRSSLSSEDDIHPYANPDLVISYAVDSPPRSSLRSPITYPGISRSNSTATVTESTTNSSISRSAAHSTVTADTSVVSLASKQRSSSIQKKGISLPIPARTGNLAYDAPVHSNDTYVSPIPPDVSNLHGWTQKGAPPGFSLISLEEARAQHSRGPIIQTAAPRASMSTIASGSTMPFPSSGHDDARGVTSLDSSPTSVSNSRSRARSISATKAKNALQTIVGSAPKLDRRDSEPAVIAQQGSGRSLRHKKSGFMRLLGRGHDRDEPPSPPPVPSLRESRTTQEFSRPPPKRVPVPSLWLADGDKEPPSYISSPKRTPTLSITTQPQSPFSRLSEGTYSSSDASQIFPLEAQGRARLQEALPQSAPPNISEFPALRLRPVSTLFSAQFDGIVSSDTVSPSETDLDTPRSSSPSGIISPVSPYSRKSNKQSDDPTLIIKNLQEEIISAKKAWQMQKWEFEGQIRDLQSEIDELRAENSGSWCEACGRGQKFISGADGAAHSSAFKATSVVNRPRARTGFTGMAI
ncbi:hypothetical protein BDQ17DRAFT_49753 [Cyathus striatus]|nr:hypothetical protein BDQ17DRAFT_49753 [Cyathus striatus]